MRTAKIDQHKQKDIIISAHVEGNLPLGKVTK